VARDEERPGPETHAGRFGHRHGQKRTRHQGPERARVKDPPNMRVQSSLNRESLILFLPKGFSRSFFAGNFPAHYFPSFLPPSQSPVHYCSSSFSPTRIRKSSRRSLFHWEQREDSGKNLIRSIDNHFRVRLSRPSPPNIQPRKH